MHDPNEYPEMMDAAMICELFGKDKPLTKATLRKWIKDGTIPPPTTQLSKNVAWWKRDNLMKHCGINLEIGVADTGAPVSRAEFENLVEEFEKLKRGLRSFVGSAA